MIQLIVGTICTSFLAHLLHSLRSDVLPSNDSLSGTSISSNELSLQHHQQGSTHTRRGWGWGTSVGTSHQPQQQPHTLVLYIFSNTDKEYINNLRYFVRNGMWEGDGCEYIVVVNSDDDAPVPPPLLLCNTAYY